MSENVCLLELELGHRIDGDGWTQDGNAYYSSHEEGEPNKVEEDGSAYSEESSLADCKSTASSWYWDSGNTRLYLHTSGTDDPVNYIVLSYFWEYLTNVQYTDEDVEYNGNIYLPYLNAANIPKVKNETSEYNEGGTKQSFGSIGIINTDGRYDERLTDYIYEAKKYIFRLGEKGDAFGSFSVFSTGWTGGVEWNDRQINIETEDLRRYNA